MKKKLVKIIVIAIVALVVLVVAVVLGIDRIAKSGTEVGATYALGVPTTLNSADIGILEGKSELQQLTVNNPQGFDTPHFLKLNRGALSVSLGSLTGDRVEVPLFALEGIELNLEKKGAQSNYQAILDNLKRFESKEESEPEKKEGKRFIIREIVIKDVKVHVKLSPLPDATVSIPELRLKDVGSDSDKGVLVADLTGVLLKAIIMAAVQQGGGLIPTEMLGDLEGALKNLAPLKDVGASLAVGVEGATKEISEGVKAATTQVQEGAKKAAEEVTGKLGDLLKKPKEEAPR
jgi:hypothetical protein